MDVVVMAKIQMQVFSLHLWPTQGGQSQNFVWGQSLSPAIGKEILWYWNNKLFQVQACLGQSNQLWLGEFQ